jgi:hypothetical protein
MDMSQEHGDGLDPITILMADREIRNLRGRYWRMADTKEWEEYGNLFAPDGTFSDHAANFHCHGREEVVRKIGGVLANCQTVHHGHQAEIYIDDETHARGIWMLEDYLIFPPGGAGGGDELNPYPASTVKAYGHYMDDYVKLDGVWRFQAINLYRLRVDQFTPTTFVHEYPAALHLPIPPRPVPQTA